MDVGFRSTPLFSVGQVLATFLVSCGILSKAWEEILNANTDDAKDSSFGYNECEDVVYVTFPSLYREDFLVTDKGYGECNIQTENRVFFKCLKGNDDQPALVHKGALNQFLYILDNSDLQNQVERFTSCEGKKVIVFVGHSIGGAVATLVTLWFLAKRLKQISPFCITFGSPLVGDVRFGEAIGREGWTGNFCHVVSKHDIVPRMLFAPFESIAEPLKTVLPHWRSVMGIASTNESCFSAIKEACKTLLNNYLSIIPKDYPGKSSLTSPYKPFGTYMFYSSCGTACIEDPEAVLKMLHFTMQSKEGKSFDEVACTCLIEHTGYDNMLDFEHITKCFLKTRRIQIPVSDSFEMGIALQLEAMGIEAQNHDGCCALREAAEVKRKYDMTIAELNDQLSHNQSTMAELEWYKARCEAEGPGYFDFFRQQNKRDVNADYRRITLGRFWDDIIDKVEKHELPNDFQFRNKWINAGTAYRRLVEPLDIAHHYHIQKNKGSYLSQRHKRHTILEKWLKEKDETRRLSSRDTKQPRTRFASLTEDSCFWARLEEACKDLTSFQEDQDQVMHAHRKEGLVKFENYVWRMIEDRSISGEVFLPYSRFMTWWKKYRDVQIQPPDWTSSSSLLKFVESESWKLGN